MKKAALWIISEQAAQYIGRELLAFHLLSLSQSCDRINLKTLGIHKR